MDIEALKKYVVDHTREYGRVYCGWDGLIEAAGFTIVHSFDLGDYQGESFYALRAGDRFGFLELSYGSCSGCDALQGACDDGAQDVINLAAETLGSIIWHKSRTDLISFLRERDWETVCYGDESSEHMPAMIAALEAHQ